MQDLPPDAFLERMQRMQSYGRAFWLTAAILFLPIISVVLLIWVAFHPELRTDPAILTAALSVLASAGTALFFKKKAEK